MAKGKLLAVICVVAVSVLIILYAIQKTQGHTGIGLIAGRDISFVVDYQSKFFGDNTVFCQDIAIASLMVMSRPGQGPRIMESIGLNDVRVREVGTIDNDRHWLLTGHRLVEYQDQVRVIIIASIPGVYGIQGWFSNFDVGADAPEYFELTGSGHPEWINRYNHKGFDVTANRVIAGIRNYMRTIQSDAQPVLWITGFSRGGAIAGIVGAYFERDPEVITFTYTFASPKVTTLPTAYQYQTIFNIINEDDMVTMILPAGWGFTRFGRDISVSISEYGEEAFRRLTRENYALRTNHHDNMESFLREFAELIPSREALYVFDDNIYFVSEDFPTRDEAEDEKRRLDRRLRRELRQFAEFYIYELPNNEGYKVIHYQTFAFLLKGLVTIMEYAEGTGSGAPPPYLTRQFLEIADDFIRVFDLGHPHSPAAYYLIITDLFTYTVSS